MNNYTNIVTLREYSDGSQLLQINGRDVPDFIRARDFPAGNGDGIRVDISIAAAQFNRVMGDDPVPTTRGAPEAKLPPKMTWWQVVANDIRQNPAMTGALLSVGFLIGLLF